VSLPRRLRRLPTVALPAALLGADAPLGRPPLGSAPDPPAGLRVAHGPLARLLGLAFLGRPSAPVALLLPRTRSVHTAGMRFALDLYWVDAGGRVVRVDRAVRPWRVRACSAARAVVERPSSCPR
jgi:uncharacterized protein